MRFISRTGTIIATFVLTLVAFGAPTFAQGLGEITVDSALNQPLRAHIELLDVGKLDVTQIRVALASEAEFALAHVERSSNLSQLTFKVEVERNGTGRIMVTSQSDIAEPVLNFLVGVSWPNGRTLREYTVLLDLKSNKSAAVSAAVAGSSTRAGAGSTAQGYEVQKGDTLYQIAEQTRPSPSVGVQQMMLALQRANEDAFVNNNVNRILTGKVLRIPRQDEIALIDQDAAVAQINQQNLETQPLAVNDATGPRTAAPRDELTLLSGAEEAGSGSSDLDKTIKQLENQLMLSEESLDRSKLENLELTNRLAAVQEQIDLLQNIIAIEDERIAQLQKQLTSQSVATKDALNNAESAAKAAGEGDAGEGILGLLTNSVVLLGGLLAVAIGVALMLFIKRRNARAEMTDDEEASLDELADANDEDQESAGIGSKIAALLARFRRKKDDEQGDEPVFAEEAAAPAAAVAAKPAVVTQPSSTNTLLDEMGLGSLQDDEIDEPAAPVTSHPNATPVAQAPAVMPEPDTAVEEAGAVMEEAALLQQALDEAEEEVEHEADVEDFLAATPEPAAPVAEKPAVPEAFSFTAEAVAPAEEVAELEPVEDKPEVFEFTLPSLEDIEAVESKTAEPPAAKEKVETISFSPETVQAFDEDTIEIEDDLGDEVSDATQDTHDARLDLAVAYEAMGDIDGAIEILEEVIGNGKAAQVAEAQRLKQKWQNG